MDQAITTVDYTEGKAENGADITVTNKQQMVMPILVTVEESNGKTHKFTVPVEIWKFGKDAKFHVNTTSKIKHIELDAEHQLPDIVRFNNVWKGVGSAQYLEFSSSWQWQFAVEYSEFD